MALINHNLEMNVHSRYNKIN